MVTFSLTLVHMLTSVLAAGSVSAADRRADGIFEDNKTRVGDTTL